MPETTRFIVYACPRGPLHDQIEAYYERTLNEVGRNLAHDYMPHISLTGFFRDDVSAAPHYAATLEETVFAEPEPAAVRITGMPLLPDWLGLTIEAEELRRRVATFATHATSPARPEAIRLKDNLHVSFAYGFPPDSQETLARLAAQMIDASASVAWDVRFFERNHANEWLCHYSRPLVD
jgi:hypothetical protein